MISKAACALIAKPANVCMYAIPQGIAAPVGEHPHFLADKLQICAQLQSGVLKPRPGILDISECCAAAEGAISRVEL